MRFHFVLVALAMTLITLSTASAWQPVLDCPALVEAALTNLANQCGNTEGLSACYAHEGIYAAFADASQPVTLDVPGDQVRLDMLKSLTGSFADLTNGQWGIAVLNLSPSDINITQAQYLASMLLLGDVTLENVDESGQAPMQSIKLTTGTGEKPCNNAPSALAILTNPEISLGFSVNGVILRLSSLAVFQSRSANSFSVTVHSGYLEILDGPTAQAGQTLAGVMDNTGKILFWSAPRAANPDEIQALSVVMSAFGKLGSFASFLSSPPAVNTVTPTEATSSPSTCGTVHVVQAGENLFRIALRYNTRLDAVTAANGLASPYLIQPGQQLVIPCSS